MGLNYIINLPRSTDLYTLGQERLVSVYNLYIFHTIELGRTMSTTLLLKFKQKDTVFGVTRQTLRAVADRLGLNETTTIHMALSNLAKETLPAYEPDDGPLTDAQLKAFQNHALRDVAPGARINFRSLV